MTPCRVKTDLDEERYVYCYHGYIANLLIPAYGIGWSLKLVYNAIRVWHRKGSSLG